MQEIFTVLLKINNSLSSISWRKVCDKFILSHSQDFTFSPGGAELVGKPLISCSIVAILKFLVMFSSTLHVVSEFWWGNGVCVWSFKTQLSCGPAICSLMAGIRTPYCHSQIFFAQWSRPPSTPCACGHLDWYGRGILCPVLAVPSGFGDYSAKLSLLTTPIQLLSAPENGGCWLLWCEKLQHAHKIMTIVRTAKTTTRHWQ